MILYDCVIIGGGIAGIQASIQLGRYKRNVLVLDKGKGRSTLCRKYRNILGWPEGVSGEELRRIGKQQGKMLGVLYQTEEVVAIERTDHFQLLTRSGQSYIAKRLLFATGVTDPNPFPQLEPCLGSTVYICPDCDGFEVQGKKALILGSGKSGVHMAKRLHHWASELIYINHTREAIREKDKALLRDMNVQYIEERIQSPLITDQQFNGVKLHFGERIEAKHAFIAFGKITPQSDLARKLGCERMENGHLITEARTKKTNVQDIYAAGDVGVHAEQVTIAMGEGTLAAVWIEKSLAENNV
ncbi:NAD(P)/FAD-dependent oxidoreductase [Geomicrobium sp. JCM 19038]|uniref:NAD(P)/FAD-dependent oxidoreductase n=1 Tax=Geomicrobium sp. JCM 19038 TaxID=1460635 RepID=UPI00045F2B3B|nr:NAD(P)/FAD-dependent oxidoreductase [Geomicrobium sp. JCM 19038]GAK10343.1 thioredoxin reductase [Geomicrobium sp. JCM 19038]